MAKTFIGKPVVNVVHKDVSPKDFSMGNADGIVTDVWYDPADGWFWAKFLVWDPATQKNCESAAYSVSCAYDLLESKDEGGMHNNITYSQEVVNGEYTHLAIVANPRYEGARILYNSKGGKDMKWKFWQGGKEKVELQNISENSTVEIDGKKVAVKELMELHNSAKPAITEISMDTIIEADGKELLVKDLVAGYKASIKNADDKEKEEKEKKENAEDEEKEKKEKEAKNAEDEKKKKDDEERKNAEEKKKDEEEKERKNEGEKHFVDVRNAAQVRGAASMPTLITRSQRMQEGAKRYGSKVETK
jgi:hypothetical protein